MFFFFTLQTFLIYFGNVLFSVTTYNSKHLTFLCKTQKKKYSSNDSEFIQVLFWTPLAFIAWTKTSRVTRVTLVLWIGNETLRSLPLWERLRVTESWTHIESRQFIGWWRDAVSDAMTSSGHTGERAIHSSDFSAEKNPVGSVRSLAANAVSRSLFREQGLRE